MLSSTRIGDVCGKNATVDCLLDSFGHYGAFLIADVDGSGMLAATISSTYADMMRSKSSLSHSIPMKAGT